MVIRKKWKPEKKWKSEESSTFREITENLGKLQLKRSKNRNLKKLQLKIKATQNSNNKKQAKMTKIDSENIYLLKFVRI